MPRLYFGTSNVSIVLRNVECLDCTFLVASRMDIIAHLATPLDIKVMWGVKKKTCAIISIRGLCRKIHGFQQYWAGIGSRKARNEDLCEKSFKICKIKVFFTVFSLYTSRKSSFGSNVAVVVRNRKYMIIPCQEKNLDEKYYFFVEKSWF